MAGVAAGGAPPAAPKNEVVDEMDALAAALADWDDDPVEIAK